MAGTIEGGRKAAETNKERYGDEFYQTIGSYGGQSGDPSKKGFASQIIGRDGMTGRERAREAGSRGGRNSRRSR